MKYKTIIDGVNVSECEYLNSLDNGVSECILGKKQMLKYRVCACNHNCYFKQHKRAEQECEELKTIINKSAEKFVNDYLETFEENQKLKDDLQNIQHNCTREGCRYYEDNTYKVFYKCKAKTELSKYKQALESIEQLVTHAFCLTNGTNKDTANLAQQIMCLVAKAKEQ